LPDKASLKEAFKNIPCVFGVIQPWSPDYRNCYPNAEVEQKNNIVGAFLQILSRLNLWIMGRPKEDRLSAHGQGYDLVKRPAVREDESMTIKANMNITVHPIAASKSIFTWVCDNYLVTENGVSDCLHRTPKRVFEL
jgi:hypothetical protein